jgi:hypothetical protein
MSRFWNTALLGAALLVPVAVAPTALLAEDHDRDRDRARVYHDRDHNDDHHWDGREDRAYRMWARENHRKYRDFNRLREQDRQAYWGWRHEHSDAVLKIDIR